MITTDWEKCQGCGNCIQACRFGAIKIVDGKAEIDQDYCNQCMACADYCPFGAIVIGTEKTKEGEIIVEKRIMNYPFRNDYGKGFGYGKERGYGKRRKWR
jgi:MinD superfamily P-loop ATPase containing an inserted ferredoxin domain